MGSYGVHRCDVDGRQLGVMGVPEFITPGNPIELLDTGLFGRVRLVWRCCGAVLVEMVADQDDPECSVTVTVRCVISELLTPDGSVSYSIPCIGAEWSLHLPCGHIAGEGCDCDTIASEAADQG